ncbi:tRNA (guanosine(37)-N1)-methyltransferase TrmD [candidate division WOR-3 bacterium]|jgi:tRNA (guanine37-N1)-methyltransferase|nr:tRNA (guanosine(37)-N1)-methyltransferase TrmD [candidate division WOR-3 bacterium]
MLIDILTIFPEFFSSPSSVGNIKIAIEKGLMNLHIHNIRDYSKDRHRKTDDYGFGGGSGMIMMIQPVYDAYQAVKSEKSHVILFTPQGDTLKQKRIEKIAEFDHLIFICGRYKGIDSRVDNIVDEKMSIGDYIVSGGEFPAIILLDSIARLMPEVIGDIESAREDSFSSGLLDSPRFTRPRLFNDLVVPDILLSGNHKEIGKWRRQESLKLTFYKKPYLLSNMKLSKEDKKYIDGLNNENAKEE